MPSPSADTKFVLGIVNFLSILKFLKYTQIVSSILKWANLCSKISHLSIPKTILKKIEYAIKFEYTQTNFVFADGLGISIKTSRYIYCEPIKLNPIEP